MADDDPTRAAHDIRASLINLRGFCGELDTALIAARQQMQPGAAPLMPPLDDARFCADAIRQMLDRLERQLEPNAGPHRVER